MESNRIFSSDSLKIIAVCVVVAVLLMVACAEVAPPPGGEEDKVSPFLVSSFPANGAINVETGNRAILYFSERIVKPRNGVGVFISPRAAEAPKLKWKSDHIIVEFADSFTVDQTYIISVSSDITDLRNNRLDSSLVVAFSTGATIDSGSIAGIVEQGNALKGGVLVGLYEPAVFDDTMPLDSIYPRYLSQSNNSGQFSFQYLPPTEYRMVAFMDKSRDERLNPDFESFGVPDRSVDLSDKLSLENLRLPLTSADTTTPAILSAVYTSDQTLRLRLSREIDLSLLNMEPSRLALLSLEDSLVGIVAKDIQRTSLPKASTLLFYFGAVDEGDYWLNLRYDQVKPSLVIDTFKVALKDDENPPEMAFVPDSLPQFLGQLKMAATFSEPLDTSALSKETFLLSDAEGNRQKLEYEWENAFTLRFTSSEMSPGNRYRLGVAEFEITDAAGNVMGDSLTEFTVVTIDRDSLGSVSGEVKIELAEKVGDPIVLAFYNIGTRQTFNLKPADSSFTIDLPAGKYLLSGFIDSDANGTRDLGSVIPYRFSETRAVHPDTVAVRARFETAGITFNFE